jgi:hypothetical protein
LLLAAAGPLNITLEQWLGALGLVAVPWYVHVLALPMIFRVSATPQVGPAALLLRSAVFLAVAAMLIPFLGIFAFLCIGIAVSFIASRGNLRMPIEPQTLAAQALGVATWMLTVLIVGAAIGALLHIVRTGDLTGSPALPHKPGVRSDVLGGALAAFLAFGGMSVALPLGLFSRQANVHTEWMHQLAVPPQLPSSVLIVVVAMLPHLLMTGREILACSSAREC